MHEEHRESRGGLDAKQGMISQQIRCGTIVTKRIRGTNACISGSIKDGTIGDTTEEEAATLTPGMVDAYSLDCCCMLRWRSICAVDTVQRI